MSVREAVSSATPLIRGAFYVIPHHVYSANPAFTLMARTDARAAK